MKRKVVVLKFGSSVLPTVGALRRSAIEIERHTSGGRTVFAVVSARPGVTDELFRTASRFSSAASAESLVAALQATGEESSAALVALAVAERGLDPVLLDARATGLVAGGSRLRAIPHRLETTRLEAAVGGANVVVVPGYVCPHSDGGLALLGRGGSDLTALFLAYALQAERCRLLKDVDGWYVEDPAVVGNASARYASLHWDDALARPTPLVQHDAVKLAHRRRVTFEVGALGCDRPTVVGAAASRLDPRSREAIAG